MKRTRSSRSLSCLLGAASACGAPLAGCDSAQQSNGPMENIPKESPVLNTSKDSVKGFFADKKTAKPSKASPEK
jgi:hypothetical protein